MKMITRERGPSERARPDPPLLALAFLGFISLGLPDGLLGVAWPSIRRSFGISLDALGALLLTTTSGYLVASLSSGPIVARLGVGRLLAMSGFLTMAGLLGYVLAPGWWAMVGLGLLAGLGGGAVDAGVNAYAAVNFSRRLVSWLHASYGLGAALGPLIMVTVLNVGLSWRWGYAIVSVLQAVLGTCFLLTAGRWHGGMQQQEDALDTGPDRKAHARHTFSLPIVWLSITLFFVYTGIEAGAGQWAFTLFTESRSVPMQIASLWVSIYWGSLTVGRLLFGFMANRVEVVPFLRTCMLGVLSGSAMIWMNLGNGLSFLGLALMGFAAAPIFPLLISATPKRVGPAHAPNVVGFQVGAASLGIAGLPALAGVLAERVGLEIIGPCLVVGALMMLLLHEAIVRRRS